MSSPNYLRYKLLLCLALAALVSSPVSGEDSGAAPSRDQAALIDSLFAAGVLDSVKSLLPPVLDDTRARGDSVLLARLLLIQGRVGLATYDAALAAQAFERSLRIAKAIQDTTSWMTALGYFAVTETFKGRFDSSLDLNRQKLTLSLVTGNRESEAWARTGIGYAYLNRGEFEFARDQYSQAAVLFRTEGQPRAELTPLVGLGRALDALSDFNAARESYERVRRIALEIGEVGQEAHALNNLGGLEYRFGDMATAAQYYERAYELNRQIGNKRGMIGIAINIGLVKNYLGQYSDAASVLLKAIETCESSGYNDQMGPLLCMLGNVRMMQDRMNESAALYRRAMSLGDVLTTRQRNDATYGLARTLSEMDSLEAAVEVLEAGMQEPPVPAFKGMMETFLARCLRRLGRNEEALGPALTAAQVDIEASSQEVAVLGAFELSACYDAVGESEKSYQWYQKGVEALEQYRNTTGQYEWREAHGRIRLVVDGGRIILNHPPNRPDEQRIAELFDLLQKFKARTLLDRIAEPRHQAESPLEIASLAPVTIEQLQENVLQTGEVFIDFTVGNDISYCVAVTTDTCRIGVLPGLKTDLPSRVSFYLKAISNLQGNSDAAGIEPLSKTMYAQVLGPVDDLVGSASRLIISPDAYLGAVPFGMLIVPPERGGGLLLAEKEIQMVPSATVLKWLRSMQAQPSSGAVRLAAMVPEGKAELRGVRKEVAALKKNFVPVDVYSGESAFSVLRDSQQTYDIIHVAAHISANDEKPWNSGILLGDVQAESDSLRGSVDIDAGGLHLATDPYLRARDIASRSLKARLAVLSGCESALGRSSSGEGVLGLTTAFLSAGVPSIVATLWPVDDMVTADLMKEFYSGLAGGETVSTALRSAQLTIRSREGSRQPFYWAGFVVVGDGEASLPLKCSDGRGILLIIAFAGLAVVFAILLLRKRISIQ